LRVQQPDFQGNAQGYEQRASTFVIIKFSAISAGNGDLNSTYQEFQVRIQKNLTDREPEEVDMALEKYLAESNSILVCSFSEIGSRSFPFEVYFCAGQIQAKLEATLQLRIAEAQRLIDEKAVEVGRDVETAVAEQEEEQERLEAEEALNRTNENREEEDENPMEDQPETARRGSTGQEAVGTTIQDSPVPFKLALPKGQDFEFEKSLQKLPGGKYHKGIAETEVWKDLLELCANKARIMDDRDRVEQFTDHLQALVKPFCKKIFAEVHRENDHISQKRILNDLYMMENAELRAEVKRLLEDSRELAGLQKEHSVLSALCSEKVEELKSKTNDVKRLEAMAKEMEKLKAGEKELIDLRLEKKRLADALKKLEENKNELEAEKANAQERLDSMQEDLARKTVEYTERTQEADRRLDELETRTRDQEALLEARMNEFLEREAILQRRSDDLKIQERDLKDKQAKEQAKRREQANLSGTYSRGGATLRVNPQENPSGLGRAQDELLDGSSEKTLLDSRGKSRPRGVGPNVFGQESEGQEAMDERLNNRTVLARDGANKTGAIGEEPLFESMAVGPEDDYTQSRIGLKAFGIERSNIVPGENVEGEGNTVGLRGLKPLELAGARIKELEWMVRELKERSESLTERWRESDAKNKELNDDLRGKGQRLRALEKGSEGRALGFKQGVERVRNWNNLQHYCCCCVFLLLLIPLLLLGYDRSREQLCAHIN
jgi:hypothetical protein